MALGVTVDFTTNLGNLAGQVDRAVAQLDRFQQRAQATTSLVNKAFGALGVGLSVAGLVSFVKSGIDMADALNDISLKTGIAVENLAGFQLVTKQSGTDMDAFTMAANKLSVNIAKNSEEFAKLGITAKDPAVAFEQLASVFASIEDPQQRAAVAAKALGKSWQEMAPLLSMGGEEMRKAVEKGTKLSGMTQKMASDADAFNDSLEVMHQTISRLSISIGGPIIEKFNQFAATMSDATQKGVNFYSVMKGFANFGVRNYFTGFQDIMPTKDLDGLNKKIEAVKSNLKSVQEAWTPINLAKKLGFKGQNFEEVEIQKNLNNLLAEREKLLAPKPKAEPTPKAISDFIGGGGEKAATHAAASHARANTAVNQLQKSYESMLESLTKEIALRDKNSEAAKLEYEIINGSLKGLGPMQQSKLMNLAKEKDSLETQDKKWAALVESANAYYDLRKSNDDLIRSGEVQAGFNEAIAKVDDELKNFTITSEQAKVEFTKLGRAYNDEFISPAVKATDKMSEFAIQASRNMETAFANFLFDPFNSSMDGMLDGFITTLRKMAAEAAAAMIFDSLKSKGGKWIDLAVTGISSWFGGTASAQGNVFRGGNVIPFAGGGVINKPSLFPMYGGKIGLLGEAGPEAIMPLSRDASGRLGIKSQVQVGHTIIVNVQSGPAPDVRRAAGQGAREALGLIGGASRYS